jgi:hypothetical protein
VITGKRSEGMITGKKRKEVIAGKERKIDHKREGQEFQR